MDKLLIAAGLSKWTITYLGSASEDTQYCLGIWVDLYIIKVNRIEGEIKAKYLCDPVR